MFVQAVGPSVHCSVALWICVGWVLRGWSVDWLIGRSDGQSVSWSVDLSISWLFSLLFGPFSRSVGRFLIDLSADW